MSAVNHDLIRQPRQDRSAKTMERILDAFEMLIQKRPYEEITIADIAKESKTGSSSIYARFQDKRAILLAVHERVRGQATGAFEELCAPERWAAIETAQAIRTMLETMMAWYRQHHDIMRAALLLNDDVIYERVANTVHGGALQLSYFIQDRFTTQPRLKAVKTADLIFRLITAVFQQMAIFGNISPTKDMLSDEAIIDGLLVSVLAQLET